MRIDSELTWASLIPSLFLTAVPPSLLCPLKAVLRYLRSDNRMSSVTFNNLVLADGQQHRLLFHLRGMQQQGPGGVELHLDCRLVETVRDLPAAFQGLPAGYGMVELKTMQARDQVTPPSLTVFTYNDGSVSVPGFPKWLSCPLRPVLF